MRLSEWFGPFREPLPRRSKTSPMDNFLPASTNSKTESVKPEDAESKDLRVNVFVRLKDWLKKHDGKIVVRKIKYKLAFSGSEGNGKWIEYNCFIYYRENV